MPVEGLQPGARSDYYRAGESPPLLQSDIALNFICHAFGRTFSVA